jgi:hypothetical protein
MPRVKQYFDVINDGTLNKSTTLLNVDYEFWYSILMAKNLKPVIIS